MSVFSALKGLFVSKPQPTEEEYHLQYTEHFDTPLIKDPFHKGAFYHPLSRKSMSLVSCIELTKKNFIEMNFPGELHKNFKGFIDGKMFKKDNCIILREFYKYQTS